MKAASEALPQTDERIDGLGASAGRYFLSNNPPGVAAISAGEPGAAYCCGSALGGRLSLGGTRRPCRERNSGRLSAAGIRFANGGREFPNEGLESVSPRVSSDRAAAGQRRRLRAASRCGRSPAPAAGRLLEEAMSEGAHRRASLAAVRLRLSAQRRPGSFCRGRAGACRRGRWPDAGAVVRLSADERLDSFVKKSRHEEI